MLSFRAKEVSYRVVNAADNVGRVFPYIRDNDGDIAMYCISPIHGRSFVLHHDEEKKDWVVGKGNGLSYTELPYIQTTKLNADTWGGLTLPNAIRDFQICLEVSRLGIKTNRMEYVLELDFDIPQNGKLEHAALLQYRVNCPYRISDYGFIPRDCLIEAVRSWRSRTKLKSDVSTLLAADILIHNLYLLHSNNIMHNALHAQNYTWALELLDFEASRSDNHPYSSAEYEKCVPCLFDIEIIQTYEVINYIAWCLGEKVEYKAIDEMFRFYGFELSAPSTSHR